MSELKKNLGSADRIVRANLGLLLLSLVLGGVIAGVWAIAITAFALYQFAGAIFGY